MADTADLIVLGGYYGTGSKGEYCSVVQVYMGMCERFLKHFLEG